MEPGHFFVRRPVADCLCPRRVWLCLFLTFMILAVWFFTPASPAGAAMGDVLYRNAELARGKLEKNREAQKYRHNWLNVIKRYDRVLENDPAGKLAAKSLLAMGDLYLGLYRHSRQSYDLDQALAHYRRLTKDFSHAPSAARAQLEIAEIYYHYKKDTDRAYVESLKVELNHPRSKTVVAEARKLMARISGPLPEGKPLSPKAPAEPSLPEPGREAAAAQKAPASVRPATVKGLRYWSNPNYTRVAVDVDREIAFRDHLLRQDPQLNKPMRLYLDLDGALVGPEVREVPIADGLLRRARIGQFNQDTVRVVLDIQNITNYRIFTLINPFRIVIDVSGYHEKPKPAPEPEATAPIRPKSKPGPLADLRETAQKRKKIPRGPARVKPDQTSLARQLGLGISRVVIDPGHGGKDRGATGVKGLREKDFTLKFSLKLAAKIRKRLGLDVVLTRSKDIFIPLEERTAIANTQGADLFISIHANAHKDPQLCGLETYFLNLATDDEAMRVAARENATTTKNMSDLQMILNDLMLNSKISESSRLAASVHRRMVSQVKKRYKGLRSLGVKQAPFYVLIGANMPSILIELGFISNRTEEARLRSRRYTDHLADGIVEGIKAYTNTMKKGR